MGDFKNAYDKIVNSFIKNILVSRGSKKVLKKDSADAYVDEMKDAVYVPSFSMDTVCSVTQHRIGDALFLEFEPKNSSKNICFYFHGSAFSRKIEPKQIKLADETANDTGVRFIIPLYLKAPDYSWQWSYSDLISIYQNVVSMLNLNEITLMGDSTGGSIALTMITSLKEKNLRIPNKIIAISPICDLDFQSREKEEKKFRDPVLSYTGLYSYIASFAGNTELSSPFINSLSVDFSDYPETHIFTGSRDAMKDDTEKFFRKALDSGVDVSFSVYKNMYHDFVLFPLFASGEVKNKIKDILLNVSIKQT